MSREGNPFCNKCDDDGSAYQKRKFPPNSKLHSLLAKRCPGIIQESKNEYTSYDILVALKKIITDDELYDVENPSIIMCDSELEDALRLRAFHVSQTRDIINNNLVQLTLVLPVWACPSANAVTARIKANDPFDVNAIYTATQGLLELLQCYHLVSKTQRVFSYKKIMKLVQHLFSRWWREDNPTVAVGGNFPEPLLKRALGVTALSRDQLTYLVRAQLTLYRGKEEDILYDQEELLDWKAEDNLMIEILPLVKPTNVERLAESGNKRLAEQSDS